MTLQGRETPELPSEAFFTSIRMRMLRHFAARGNLTAPSSLLLAVRTMAILGGCLYRTNAPPSGHRKIREGWTRLTVMADAFELRDCFAPLRTTPEIET